MTKRTTLAPGVFIRHHQSRDTITIDFLYKGIRCTEALSGLRADKKQDQQFAINTLAEIHNRIAKQTFIYSDYFPNSSRARLFGQTPAQLTLQDLFATWTKDVRRTLEYSTQRAYIRPVDRVWLPAIGAMRLNDITPEHIREVLRAHDITIKTARNYLLPLRQVLDQAVDDGLLEHNPVHKVRLKRLIAKRTSYDVDPYTPAEIDALLAGFSTYRPGWRNYFEFQFFTGCRPSETYAITWGDVDRAAWQVRIDKAIVERKLKGTKTAAGTRLLQLLPRACQAVERQVTETFLAGAEVFWNPITMVPIRDYDESGRAWQYVHRRTGIRQRNQYQTRHSFASNLLSQGANFMKTAEQLGHKDLEMLLRVYGRWIDQGKDLQAAGVTFGQTLPAATKPAEVTTHEKTQYRKL